MTAALVSVVIPVYNGERFVAQAIESVLAQTWPNLEVVAVNDGSTDSSAEVLGRYEGRIVTLHQNNRGVAEARNAGIRRARGEFIAFLDQDDWWRPEKLSRQVPVMLNNPRVGLVHSAADHYDDASGQWTEPLFPLALQSQLVGDCFRQLLKGNVIYNSSVLVRTAAIIEAGLCDTDIRGNTVQDYDLWLRVARRWELAYVPERLAVFRVHSGQGTWNRPLLLSEEARLLERVLVAEKLTDDSEMRARMASLYDQLGTAYLDAGQWRMARSSFGRSCQWRVTTRARLLYWICCFPGPVIRMLQWLSHHRPWVRRSVSARLATSVARSGGHNTG
jgi:glycosyltransferase involved in cell wall biosynthesis